MDVTVWCLICAVGALTSPGSGRVSQLPPPQNVTVDCDNFETLVYWNYSRHPVDPVFQVKMATDTGSGWDTVAETKHHHADITGHLNSTNYAVFKIKIQAKHRTHISESSPAVTFTFDDQEKDKADTLCKLDFPPITVEHRYPELTLRFQNPLHLYKDTPALKYLSTNVYPKLSDSMLKYTMIYQRKSQNITEKPECPFDEAVCEKKITISDEKDKNCVSLENGVITPAYRDVRAGRVCYTRLKETGPRSTIIIIICMFPLLLTAPLAAWGMLQCRTMTKTEPKKKPNSLDIEPSRKQIILQVHPESLSSPPCMAKNLTPSETSEALLLPEQTSDSCQDSFISFVSFGPDPKEEPYRYGSEDPEYPTDPKLTQETSGGTLSSDGYSPRTIAVEMSHEDWEDGYTARERLA